VEKRQISKEISRRSDRLLVRKKQPTSKEIKFFTSRMPTPIVRGTQQTPSAGTLKAITTLKLAGWTIGMSGALLPPNTPKSPPKTHAHKRKTRKNRKSRKSRKSRKARK